MCRFSRMPSPSGPRSDLQMSPCRQKAAARSGAVRRRVSLPEQVRQREDVLPVLGKGWAVLPRTSLSQQQQRMSLGPRDARAARPRISLSQLPFPLLRRMQPLPWVQSMLQPLKLCRLMLRLLWGLELVDDRRNTLMRWLLQAEVGDEAVDVVAAAEEDEGEDAVNCLRSSENQGQDPWVVRRRYTFSLFCFALFFLVCKIFV